LGDRAVGLREELGVGADRRFLQWILRGHSTHAAEIAVRNEYRTKREEWRRVAEAVKKAKAETS
jgi:hypothetical protein